MADTVTTIGDEARSMLNDIAASIFSDTYLLPFIKKAYDEAQKELILNGISIVKEVSALITVNSGDNPTITSTEITDLFEPIKLSERLLGSTDLFSDMDKLDWEPEIDKQDSLLYWNWRENEIKFRGANTNRQVKVKYYKSLPALTSGGSTILINGAKQFLASRAASLALFSLNGVDESVEALNSDAQGHLSKLVQAEVKRQQHKSVRRKPFRRGWR